jgi:two-component system CheB/CheR fusion protein
MPVFPPSERDATLPDSTRIVGLGASAGGLAVLEQFLAHVPSQSGLAYVVVQHLDPTHKAMLSELLQRATPMKVREVTDSLKVEADAVYVIPPDSELTVVGGKLHLTKPVQPRGQRLPIDVLFASLARAQGERSIGVVLSGMGSDGTLGLLEIKSQGGLTLAQQPESAQFDAMPRSAIAAGCVDIVALPAEMPKRILQVAGIRHEPGGRTSEPAAEDGSQPLPAILDLVRARSKHDLSSYKSSTLLRRIERRVAVHGLASVAAYEAFLRENPHEIDLLFAEILIGVTGFFRDPAVWKELKENILPEFLARRPAGARLRAWVVGCSTGEEAYSLAMLFDEVCAGVTGAGHGMIQIFATDLSLDGIAAARRGLYPAILTRDMEPERVARFFSKRGADLLVDKRIREMVLFAQHDVILDPPFTKLDLLLCRNLLIYFNAALQRRLMPLFHYSLKPGGVLVLGSAETVGRAQALFSPISPKSRIYRRKDYAATAALVDFPINRLQFSRPSAQESALDHPSSAIDNLQFLADQILLKEFAPPAVLVNERGDIVYISGRTGRYLEPAAGKANWNIHVMARPGIRTQLAVALRQVLQDKKSVELNDLRIEEDPGRPVHIMVEAIQEPKALAGMVMIVFREAPEAAPGKSPRRRQARGGDPTLAAELERAREEIRALRQEMSASSEELQATNEELQSTNEELQSANEELTTSKEEAQSMNEELQTINGELQSKLDDLALAQSDMQNLLNSTNIATLFLDSELQVRRFTDKAIDIFHLREGDVGRPLSDLASMLIYPELHADAKETLRTLVPSEKEVATTEGRWYSVRIMPYRTLANVIQGAVITFFDISAAKELESRLRKV